MEYIKVKEETLKYLDRGLKFRLLNIEGQIPRRTLNKVLEMRAPFALTPMEYEKSGGKTTASFVLEEKEDSSALIKKLRESLGENFTINEPPTKIKPKHPNPY